MNKYKIIKNLIQAREKKEVVFLFIGMLSLSIIETLGVASIVPFMAMVSDNSVIETNKYLNRIYVQLGFESIESFLFSSGVAVLIFMAISNFFNIFMNWRMQIFVHMQEYRVSLRILKKYLTQDYTFFLNHNSSDLSKNILTEIGRAMSGVLLPLLQVISKIITTLLLLALLIFADPLLAISIVFSLGFVYLCIFISVRKTIHTLGIKTTEAISLRYKILSEVFSSIKILKLKGGEAEFIKWFSSPSLKYAKFSALSNVISHAPRYLLEVVAFGGILIIVLYFISKGESNSYLVSYMALYVFAGYRLLPAMQQIYGGSTLIHYNFSALEAIAEDLLLEEKEIIEPLSNKTTEPIFSNSLKIKDVNFQYINTDEYLLKNINMSIKRNSSIGIVGETGSGKSTLIDIILGLHQPNDGGVYIDDIKIDDNSLPKWKSNIGYVPQDIYLSDDTIEKNIAFMTPDLKISKDKVIESAKIANIHEFIMSLPQKYETEVGERGVRLSGGQKQRLGIARALYDDPQLLVLDEATSAMDSIVESLVMNAINSLRNRKTLIMVAHRISTVRDCDVIYLIQDGRILDSGPYDKLYERSEQFRKMVKK